MSENGQFWTTLPVKDIRNSVEFFKKLGLDARLQPEHPGFASVSWHMMQSVAVLEGL
jgi:predicted lactoylglutathione lyase